MDPKRVLIVEPDHAFALSLASLFRDDGHATAVAGSAAEAELEIATRRPHLAIVRAELPDLSGFSLCAHLRHDRATAGLPVVLFSSDTPPESLAEHARTPWAANGYLAMPLDTDALRVLANRILATEEPIESADDAILEADDLVVQELHGEEIPDAHPGEAPPPGPADGAAPPAPDLPQVPALPKRSITTDEDRLFVDRVFQSISEHRDELVREAMARRPPPRPDLLGTPEGRIEALRRDVKWREAQIARIAEIWEVREREVAAFDQRLHERDVDLAGLKSQVEDLSRRLVETRDVFVEKERQYGASMDGLLLEKFSQEKQLIEVVAANERRIHELERDVRRRDDDLAHRRVALGEAQEEIARLDRQVRADAARTEARERELEGALERRTAELAASQEAHQLHRATSEEFAREASRKLEEGAAVRRALEEQLARERAEAEAERERAAAAAREAIAGLQARIDEREAAIRDREEKLRLADEEHRRFREAARAREDDLSREVQDHLQQLAALEAELEAAERESAEREAEAQEAEAQEAVDGEAGAGPAPARPALELAEVDGLLAAAKRQVERLSAELSEARQAAMIAESSARQELDAARAKASELAALLAGAAQERDELRGRHAALAADLETRDAELASAVEEAKEARAARERLEVERAGQGGPPPADGPKAG